MGTSLLFSSDWVFLCNGEPLTTVTSTAVREGAWLEIPFILPPLTFNESLDAGIDNFFRNLKGLF